MGADAKLREQFAAPDLARMPRCQLFIRFCPGAQEHAALRAKPRYVVSAREGATRCVRFATRTSSNDEISGFHCRYLCAKDWGRTPLNPSDEDARGAHGGETVGVPSSRVSAAPARALL